MTIINASVADLGQVSANDITQDVYIISPVSSGAKAHSVPKAPKYANEHIHILPYSLGEREAWGTNGRVGEHLT